MKPGDLGAVIGTYGPKGAPRRLFVAALPDTVSRHNSETRAESIRHCLEKVTPGDAKKVAVVVNLSDPDHHLAASVALARCYPLYDRTSGDGGEKKVTVVLAAALADGTPVRPTAEAKATAEAVRLAARLVDTPPQEMRTSNLEAEANFNYQVTSVCFFGHTHVPLAFEKGEGIRGGL